VSAVGCSDGRLLLAFLHCLADPSCQPREATSNEPDTPYVAVTIAVPQAILRASRRRDAIGRHDLSRNAELVSC
jgi:hypothetical protein